MEEIMGWIGKCVSAQLRWWNETIVRKLGNDGRQQGYCEEGEKMEGKIKQRLDVRAKMMVEIEEMKKCNANDKRRIEFKEGNG